ncbi:MAG: hypothetical protein ACRCUS_03680, partial [Anaerovoracaceae bacterium]
ITRYLSYSTKKLSGKKYVKTAFSTKKLGTYKITYSTYKYKYCKKNSTTITVKVVDSVAPIIVARDRTVAQNMVNAIDGVTAIQASGINRISSVKVEITEPGAASPVTIGYEVAKLFSFDKLGDYEIKVTVSNASNPKNVRVAAYKVTVE